MKTIGTRKFWKLLFWLGPFLVTAGLTIGLITATWGTVPLLFLISGAAIVAAWVIIKSKNNNWLGQRSTQAGTNALFATLAVLAILGLINFLGTRYHLRTDLTETKLFSLAPQTRELVRTLPQPVKLWIFDTNQNPLDRDLLENYRRQSNKFEFEYVDPQAKPGLAKQFGVKEAGEVYLETNQQRKLVQVVNQSERLSEIRLTNRLQQITSGIATKAYFLQGHGELQLTAGENSISEAVKGLNDKSFTTEALNLIQKADVPADANVVVVAGPKRALFDAEVKALQNYLNRGGNALLMIDPDTDPKLDPLLNEWGVKLDTRLAVDVGGSEALGPAVPIVTEYGKHPITKDFGNGISFYRLARPIETTPVNNVQATPLLLTKPYPSTWAESDQKSEKLEFNEGKDRKGPLTLGVALTKKLSATPASAISTPTPTPTPATTAQSSPTPTPTPTTTAQSSPTPTPTPTTTAQSSPTPTPTPATTPSSTTPISKESRLVVIGNSDFTSDGLFQQQLNGDVFLNSVSWLSQQDQQPLSIRPKEPKNRRINLSTAQTSLLRWSTLFILPFVGFLGAGLLWWQRR